VSWGACVAVLDDSGDKRDAAAQVRARQGMNGRASVERHVEAGAGKPGKAMAEPGADLLEAPVGKTALLGVPYSTNRPGAR